MRTAKYEKGGSCRDYESRIRIHTLENAVDKLLTRAHVLSPGGARKKQPRGEPAAATTATLTYDGALDPIPWSYLIAHLYYPLSPTRTAL
jgi:hypothetical protein